MLTYIKYLLFCYGTTAIFMYGAIAEPIRNLITWEPLKKMTTCAMCLGFWVGFLTSCYLYTDITIGWLDGLVPVPLFPSGWMPVAESVVNGIISSGVTWLLCALSMNALWSKAVLEEDYMDNHQAEPERNTVGFNHKKDEKEVELHG